MVKNKKENLKYLLIILITAIIVIVTTIFIDNFRTKNLYKRYNNLVSKTGVVLYDKVDYQLPKFLILVNGIFEDSIAPVDLEPLDTFLIGAVTTDGFTNEINDYHVIKVKDLFYYYDFMEYNSVTFKTDGFLEVTLQKNEIDDDVFLTFDKNGYEYPEHQKVGLLIPKKDIRYSITNIEEITFN
ncbi:MAG: hypothetical protein E7172_04005 [Firmicutes bacterium]|nr:hypothetical protein [Bacillota bacterium]